MAMGQRPTAGGAEGGGASAAGMHKLQRLNSANAAFRDRRASEDGPPRGGMLQAPMASGAASGSTLVAVGGTLGNMGSSEVQNHDNNNGQRFQNQAYAAQQSQQQYNQRHAMRAREQRASASAGRDGSGLNAQQDRGSASGHPQGGAGAAQDHYTMRFGQLGHFGQQVAAGHLSGRSAGQANQRVGANTLE